MLLRQSGCDQIVFVSLGQLVVRVADGLFENISKGAEYQSQVQDRTPEVGENLLARPAVVQRTYLPDLVVEGSQAAPSLQLLRITNKKCDNYILYIFKEASHS